jgi:hypothetical protein
MSKWTVVKNPTIQKSEKFISNFWGTEDYLSPTINMTFMNTSKQIILPPIEPIDVDPSEKYYPEMSKLKNKLLDTKTKLDGYNIYQLVKTY